MTSAPEVGAFLPCNLVREIELGRCSVDVVSPVMMAEMLPGAEDLADVAKEVGARFETVLNEIG